MVSSRAARLGTLVIAVAAIVNIAIGVALAWRDPSRAADLSTIYDWTRGWILNGARHYTGVHDAVDYPPNAIVVLSPLGLLPRQLIVPIWILVGLALAAVLPYLAIRCAAPRTRVAALPLLLFWCWTGTRTLLQFTPLSLALALASALTADSRRVASGVLLGLALFKPHIAGPFALWMLVSGRLRVLAVAIAVVAGGIGAYSARVGENPAATLRGYWPSLVDLYSGGHALNGRTSVREPIAAAIADPRTADAIWIATAVCLVAAAIWLAWRDPRRPLHDGGIAIPALFCLCSLAAIYHNINNLILMLPAFVFLWCGRGDSASRRWTQIACLQAALVVDLPTRLDGLVPRGTLAAFLVANFDRLLVLACLVDVTMAWIGVSRRGGDGSSADGGATVPVDRAARLRQ
jgi:glycosyl transferase family 87